MNKLLLSRPWLTLLQYVDEPLPHNEFRTQTRNPQPSSVWYKLSCSIRIANTPSQQRSSWRPITYGRARDSARRIPSFLDLKWHLHCLEIPQLPNHRDGLLADTYDHRRNPDVEDR
jgi:hypothetical protein